MITVYEIVVNEDAEGGRSQHVSVALCVGHYDDHDGHTVELSPAESELLRRVTAKADYVLHVKDAVDGEELIDALAQDAERGGLQALRDILDTLVACARAARQQLRAGGRWPGARPLPNCAARAA